MKSLSVINQNCFFSAEIITQGQSVQLFTCAQVRLWRVQVYGAQVLAIVFSPFWHTNRVNHRNRDDVERKSRSGEKEKQTCFAAAAAAVMDTWKIWGNIRAWNSKSKQSVHTWELIQVV